MIDDIVFDIDIFIMDSPVVPSGVILSYSMDGSGYDYIQGDVNITLGGEVYF